MSGGQEQDPQNSLLARSFRVRTDEASVCAFAAALGVTPRPGHVPHTFPVSWLSTEEVRTAISRLGLPIQTFQSFSYARPLALNADYVLNIRLAAAGRESAFRCDASVQDMAGVAVLEMKSEIIAAAPPAVGRTLE